MVLWKRIELAEASLTEALLIIKGMLVCPAMTPEQRHQLIQDARAFHDKHEPKR